MVEPPCLHQVSAHGREQLFVDGEYGVQSSLIHIQCWQGCKNKTKSIAMENTYQKLGRLMNCGDTALNKAPDTQAILN
jgi:hypothetical protein